MDTIKTDAKLGAIVPVSGKISHSNICMHIPVCVPYTHNRLLQNTPHNFARIRPRPLPEDK